MRLITIPISHYVEKARWALDRSGLPYTEEGHAQLMHWRATRPLGSKTVPVLVDGATVLTDSTAILHYVDARTPEPLRLYPPEPGLRQQVQDLEEQFDVKLGPHTRRLGYYTLFPLGRKLVEPLRGKVPAWELQAFWLGFDVGKALIGRGLNITADKAAESHQRIVAQFDAVAQRLAGRPYLVGDRFSAADLTFAALAGPLLDVPEHPVPLIALAQTPMPFRVIVGELRAHPAGQYALALYAKHRRQAEG